MWVAVPQGVRQGERDVSFGNADSMPQGHEGCRPVGDEAGESKSSGAGLQARRSDGDGAPGQARGPRARGPGARGRIWVQGHTCLAQLRPHSSATCRAQRQEGARHAVQDARWLQLGRDAEAGSV